MPSSKNLRILNARENNLKNLNLEIPHDSFTVLTGLSGSGKSSLAFGTIYAEGQRRYIETFSPYTRQFFDKVKKPDVDLIENVRPAIAIQQRTRILNSRSTVGSITDINDYLKVLWSNLATAICPICDIPLRSWTPESLASHLVQLFAFQPKSTFLIGASVHTKSMHAERERLTTLGYSRFFNFDTGEISREEDSQSHHQTPSLLVVLDRIRSDSFSQVSESKILSLRKRLRDSIEQAFSLTEGYCTVVALQPGRRSFLEIQNSEQSENKRRGSYTLYEFSTSPQCSRNNVKIQKPRPSLFSFNHPLGACPDCKGFGNVLRVDLSLCIPDPSKSITENCIVCWNTPSTKTERKDLLKFCEKHKISIQSPWRDLSRDQQNLILQTKNKEYWGVFPWFQWVETKTYKMHIRVFLTKFRSQVVCPTCHGTRVKPDALSYRILGRTLPEVWSLPVGELLPWMDQVSKNIRSGDNLPREVRELFSSIRSRLQYLSELGLSYLTLDRQARTLSGGETQRVNLVAALGSDLVSTQFVLDEPSVGLHARDTDRLIRAVQTLHRRGNSVIAVEHDPDFIAAADRVIELGPDSGETGGHIVFSDDVKKWKGIPVSHEIKDKGKASFLPNDPVIEVRDASLRNLRSLSVDIPKNRFVALTGVSGSGKSTLVTEILKKGFDHLRIQVDDSFSLSGIEDFAQVLLVDQSPLAKSPRANIGTYSKIWDTVRDLLAATEDAKLRGLTKSSFSFNVNAGRCTACDGAGFIREDMQFLSDVYIPCEVCLGERFQPKVLEVRHEGHNVHDLLQMSVEQCGQVFHAIPSIAKPAATLITLGLGHLRLGHPLSELSGGEAQRLKLVPFVQQSERGKSLLIFDEPTTGLHVHDVERLIGLLRYLRDLGHSILCVEHNLTLLLSADWIIDLGPEGGAGGGTLVFQGSPDECLKSESGFTSQYLRDFYQRFYEKKKVKTLLSPRIPPSKKQHTSLKITGARVHNLKNLDIEIPLNMTVALTGVSGSGKSSIAKDIIYAEGQRRYLDCLSPYARQFIKGLEKPDIDHIENIMPTLCVYQHTFQPSGLSTVATMSEVYNFLRLLYAKSGIQYCPDHPDQSISSFSPDQMAQRIKECGASSVRLLAPIIKSKKGNHRAVFERALAMEILEVRVDGVMDKASSYEEGLLKSKVHSIDFTIAKFNPTQVPLDIIAEAVHQALRIGDGEVILHTSNNEEVLSTDRSCPVCHRGFFKPDPEDLSFSSKRGKCQKCQGTGLTASGKTCTECQGTRIGELGRNLRIQGRNIFEACKGTPSQLRKFLEQLSIDSKRRTLIDPILRELFSKIATLEEIGIDYIELTRDCSTLSGGELQRLRLATAMGSPLSGVMYIFDEPSVGLHPNDNKKVIEKLAQLKDRGNSVIIIEHDIQTILSSDYILEIGPGGGIQGGNIVFSGKKGDLLNSIDSPLAISIRETEENLSTPKIPSKEHQGTLKIVHGGKNTIQDLKLTLPLHSFISVAGLSGSGKSSLVHGIISDSLTLGKESSKKGVLEYQYEGNILQTETPIDRVLLVDQQPIGANSRSTPASYLKIWDEIRKVFSHTVEAKAAGWGPSFFSYNTGKGRCPECGGLGQIKLEMSFLADAAIPCETCGGRRFTEEADAVRFLGLSISEVLRLTFEEAKVRFANHRKIHQVVRQACELGLGYLTLGQGSSTLSGGESQRIKLVSELSARPAGHTLYILDEPTTGLHKADVGRLTKTLHELVDRGNTVLVIEHDPDILRASDQVIEMGPGAGPKGGKVIFQGSPKKLFQAKTPWGVFLREEQLLGATHQQAFNQ